MSREKIQPINKASRLQALGLPHLEMILQELFLVPPAFFGASLPEDATIADLITYSGIKEDEVLRQLRQLQVWTRSIWISLEELQKLHKEQSSQIVVFNIDDEPIEQVSIFARQLDPSTFSEELEQAKLLHQILVIASADEAQALSGALYCKNLGFTSVFALSSF